MDENQSNLTPEEQAELHELLANLKQDQTQTSRSESIPWLALLGAALGSIPGILAWFGLGMLGVTWALVGAVIVIGVFFLYDKFGGETDNQYGIIGCVLICLIAVYLGVHLAWSGQLYQAINEDYHLMSFGECVTGLYNALDILEIRGKFVGAVLKGYLFAGLGAFGVFGKALKQR